MTKRIGIYAGSFDPIHEGHIAFAKEAMEQAGLDKVFFLVEPRPRRKQGVKAFEHRLIMVRLGIEDDNSLGLIVLEHARFDVLKTWPQLQARFKGAELYMLMGEDVFGHLANWPKVDRLLAGAHFIVGLRGQDEATVREHLSAIEQTRGFKLRYSLFRPTAHNFSSQQLRTVLRRGQVPAGLHPNVLKYIQSEKLYSSAAAA